MYTSKITFQDLKKVSDSLIKGDEQILLDFINSFKGEDVYEKFINVLKSWAIDVSPTINFSNNGKDIKLQISYAIAELENPEISSYFTVEHDIFKASLGIPKDFQNKDLLPVYDIFKTIDMMKSHIDLTKVGEDIKIKVINSLPPVVYTFIYKTISDNRSKIAEIKNPAVSNLRINFLLSDPYVFIKNLFSMYNEDFFRDVIFNLSNRIDGKLLMESTLQDIEYYIEKLSKEVEKKNNNLQI